MRGMLSHLMEVNWTGAVAHVARETVPLLAVAALPYWAAKGCVSFWDSTLLNRPSQHCESSFGCQSEIDGRSWCLAKKQRKILEHREFFLRRSKRCTRPTQPQSRLTTSTTTPMTVPTAAAWRRALLHIHWMCLEHSGLCATTPDGPGLIQRAVHFSRVRWKAEDTTEVEVEPHYSL